MLSSLEPTTVVKTILFFLKMCEELLLERVNAGRQQSSSTSYYNPTGWITITCMSLRHQKYRMLQKGFKAGLNKQQISNVFANQEVLRVANISPLTAIYTFSGARNGKMKADFYDDCQNIPDPSALDPCKRICCCWTFAS